MCGSATLYSTKTSSFLSFQFSSVLWLETVYIFTIHKRASLRITYLDLETSMSGCLFSSYCLIAFVGGAPGSFISFLLSANVNSAGPPLRRLELLDSGFYREFHGSCASLSLA